MNVSTTVGIVIPGVVFPFAGGTAPSGFLLCYGQAVSRTTYADLFDVLGTTYGAGNGTTTFNLPDLRGRTIFGKDDMGGSAASRLTSTGGITGSTLGATGGSQVHTISEAELPVHSHTMAHTHDMSHTHSVPVSSSGTGVTSVNSSAISNSTPSYNIATSAASSSTTGGSSAANTGNVGSGTAAPIVNPGLILNFIIKF